MVKLWLQHFCRLILLIDKAMIHRKRFWLSEKLWKSWNHPRKFCHIRRVVKSLDGASATLHVRNVKQIGCEIKHYWGHYLIDMILNKYEKIGRNTEFNCLRSNIATYCSCFDVVAICGSWSWLVYVNIWLKNVAKPTNGVFHIQSSSRQW